MVQNMKTEEQQESDTKLLKNMFVFISDECKITEFLLASFFPCCANISGYTIDDCNFRFFEEEYNGGAIWRYFGDTSRSISFGTFV